MSGSITAKSRFYGEDAGGGEKWEENFTPEASEPQKPSGGMMLVAPSLLRVDSFCREAREERGEACREGFAPAQPPDSIAVSHMWLCVPIKRGAGLQISGKYAPGVQRPWVLSPELKMDDGGYMTDRQKVGR